MMRNIITNYFIGGIYYGKRDDGVFIGVTRIKKK